MTLHDEARAALAAKSEAEGDLARAADCPPWRHAVVGVVMAALVVSPVLPTPLRFGAMVLILVGIFGIVAADRRRTGVFVNGYRRGKTLVVSLVMLVALAGLFMASARAGAAGNFQAPLLLAGVAFVVTVTGSVIWQRIFVAELNA